VKAICLGIIAESIALACAYGIYIYWERISLYGVFYLPIDNRLIVPAIVRFGLSNYRGVHLFADILLVLVNSLKWAGCVRLFQLRKRMLAAILVGLLVATVLVSVSWKNLSI
jgi:hypothetical protein